MRKFSALLFLLLSCFLLPSARPQTASPPTAKPATPTSGTTTAKPLDYSTESFVIQKYATDVTYSADGTGERLITVEVKVQSDAAVRQFGLLEFPYESRNEHLDFVYVRVRKPDGSVVATSDADAQDQPAEVTRLAPFYSDIRNKQLPVKSLSVGDQLEYQVREVRTVAAAPGHFWYTQSFLKNAVVLSETASLTVPKLKYVQVQSPDIKPTIGEEGDQKVYRWKTSQLDKTKVPDEKAKKPVIVEAPPSIAVTTFKSWEEVGRWYADLQRDRVGVTPAVQAKANELTKGLTSDEEKIAAIYNYVSTQYRYIGVAFGIGRYQPHSADDVMQNQYGDCKDKHTLLATLLKAAGYDAWPVLVGSQHVLQPDVPSPGQFDHVITAVTLNKSVLWMDSTPEVAPFRLLFTGLRDKQVLGIPNTGIPVLMKTPANPPFDCFAHYDGKATLASDGALTAHFDISVRGDEELLYRIGFHQTPRVQWQALVQNVSYASGFAGTVSNIDASSPEQMAKPFHYSYDYARKDYADWPNRRILPLIPPVSFAYGEDDAKPAETILLGGPVTYTFHSVITLPQGYNAELPATAKQQTDFAEYTSTYAQANGALTVDRTFTMKLREMPVSRWDEYIRFEKAVQSESGSYVQLIGAAVQASGSQTPSNPDAYKLIQEAFADIGRHSFEVAKQELDQAAKLSPNEPELWGGYGYLDICQNRVEEGIKKYQKELSLHPDRFEMYRYLATVQESHKHPDDAIQTLRALLKAAPDDAKGHQQLGSLLVRQKRFTEAIPVLKEASADLPEDAGIKVELGNAELRGGESDKGDALLREVLTTSNDKYVLNDAAYELADANVDLPLARSSCEKALRLLDEATAKTTLSALTDDDLKIVSHFAATWDTMAWILFRQGELTKAEDFAKAAWKLDQWPTLGVHLGQIYEKQGRKAEAAHVYRLAIASSIQPNMPGVEEATQRLMLLHEPQDNSVEDKSKALEELNALSTVTVPLPENPRGAADFFVLLASGGGVEETRYVSGDESMKAFEARLKGAHFEASFPPDSSARIVRRGTLYCSQLPKSCQFAMRLPQRTKMN